MSSRTAVVSLGLAAACVVGFAGVELSRQPTMRDVDWTLLDAPPEERVVKAGELDDLRAEVKAIRRGIPEALATLEVPESGTLMGQPVPLERPAVREAIAYELILTVGRPLMPMLWTRRAPAVLGPIEARLAEAGLPDDLKYVAMIESDLRWVVRSPAGAEGLWQFMAGTARRYGLTVDRYLDERRDPDRATDAAIAYLSELYEEFGDWYLVLAAYNAGENRVRRALEEQGADKSYFELYLPRETRRYVPRLMAAKLVHEDPQSYGLAPMVPYHVPNYRHVEVTVRRARADLRELAAEHELDYASLRLANPQVRGAYLPRGTHRLRVPESGSEGGDPER